MKRLVVRAILAIAVALPAAAHAQPVNNAPPDPTTPALLSVRPGGGLSVRSSDDRFALTLSSRAQVREAVVLPASGAATNDLSLRTLRLTLAGHTFSRDVRYYVQLAFANADLEPGGSPSPLYDAWIEWRRLRDLNVRVGQFFVPFDRARTTLESSLQLVDRSTVVSEFNLDRDVGVELSSRDLFGLGGRLAYAVGAFSGEGRNRAAAAPGFLFAGRLQVSPFGAFDDNGEADLERSPRPRLAIGVAGAYNQQSTRARSTSGATFVLGGFDYAHAAADLHFKWRGLSVLAEGVWRHASEDRHTGTPMGATAAVTEWSRSGYGYLVQVGYAFTSHLELAARWGQLFAADGTDPSLVSALNTAGRELGGNVSWYVQGHPYKLQADYFVFFGDTLAGARQQVRVQVQATF